MFGIEPSIVAVLGVLAAVAAAGVLAALRRRRGARDRSIDWDVGGDIV
ncbi:MAG TPA: hypothetical protein VMW31_01355 [Devosiaceae bacterium]|nr:hypothetical protein [Devosiaceae bacterium]